MINVLISSQMCINELEMDNDHTYAKDHNHNRELRILKKKFDLVLSEDEENNDIPGNVSGSSGTNSRVLQAELGQAEEDGEDITFPQDLAAEGEEEGAGFSFMPSQDLAAEGEEEGRTRDCEEVEAKDPGTESLLNSIFQIIFYSFRGLVYCVYAALLDDFIFFQRRL